MSRLLFGVLALSAVGVNAFEQPKSRMHRPVLSASPPKSEIIASRGKALSEPAPIKGCAASPQYSSVACSQLSAMLTLFVSASSNRYGAVLGGVLIHLACGSMYCWGNLISYLPSYLKYWSAEGGSGPPDASLVLALTIMSQMCGMPVGPFLESMVGPRFTALIGGSMMGGGIFLASYAKTLAQFVMSYAVMFGLGVGFAYQMPFLTGGRWFPGKKGTVQGAIISGMGASAFIFNMISTKLINPEGADVRSWRPT